jgi:hypothetical protein
LSHSLSLFSKKMINPFNFFYFKLNFVLVFSILISIVYLRFFRNSFFKESKFFMILHQMIVQGKKHHDMIFFSSLLVLEKKREEELGFSL